jgi:hypothetical protein
MTNKKRHEHLFIDLIMLLFYSTDRYHHKDYEAIKSWTMCSLNIRMVKWWPDEGPIGFSISRSHRQREAMKVKT